MTTESPDSTRPGPEPSPGRASGRGRLRWELLAFLEISALSGMAVAQPLLDVFGRSPDYFIFHRAGAGDILLLVAAVTLTPALVLWGLGATTRLAGRRARSAAQAVVLGILFAILAVQVGKATTGVRGLPLALLAALTGAGLAVCCARFSVPRQVLRVASVGPLVFGLLFVFTSAASPVVLQSGGATVAAGQSVGPHPPVVIIVLDELPLMSLLDDAGGIDRERLPNFGRLADEATWYRNATSVGGTTTFAVPAMLTGRYPGAEPVAPHYSRHPENLFTLLGDAYRIEAWENITQLCPPERCAGRPGQPRGGVTTMLRESASLLGELASPYDSTRDPTATFQERTLGEDIREGDRDPDVGPEFRMNRLGDSQPARFTEFLASLRPTTEPTLRFLHLLMPHSPWAYLPSGQRYQGPRGLPIDGRWWARLAHQRHLQQVGYTDRLLGEAMRALRATGQYDESLIIVTSDHGVSFSDGTPPRTLDPQQGGAAELAWVPLLVKEPGQRAGRVDERNWEHVDLVPTVAEHARVKLPWQVDGVSALGPPRTTGDKRFANSPGDTVTIRDPAHLAAIQQGATTRPVLPDIPELSLIGSAVEEMPITDGGPAVTLENHADYADVRPAGGDIPALAYGSLPETIAPDTPVAIALNGRIGAVALAGRDREERLRFAGLITEPLFVEGANRVELFEVTGGGTGLRRLPIR
jgi:hypothetical protein